MPIIKDPKVERDLVEYCFNQWGRASGWHRCPTSSMLTRDDIRNRAMQGCYRAIREYDPSMLTKTGEPVNLKSWCIIVMRSHVNTCRRPSIWKRETALNYNFVDEGVRDYVFGSFANTDSLYEILVSLVREDLKRRSRQHFIAFVFRIVYQFDFEEIANIMGIEFCKVVDMFQEILPVVRFYGRAYSNYSLM